MIQLDKEILRPGTYHTPDGMVNVDEKRIRRWVDTFRKMRKSGLEVPVPWEHQDSAKPMKRDPQDLLADRARNNAGFVTDLYISESGNLYGKIEIPEELEKTVVDRIRFVSPEIESEFIDGDGTTWRDAITHLALTPRPVFHRQKPFAKRLSRTKSVRLSLEQLAMPRKKRLSEEEEMLKDIEAEDDVEAEEQQMSAEDDLAESPVSPPIDGGTEEYLGPVLELLASRGIHLPPNSTEQTLMRDLFVVLNAIQAQSEKTLSHEDEDEIETEEMEGEEEENDDLSQLSEEEIDEEAMQKESPRVMLSMLKRIRKTEAHIAKNKTDELIGHVTRFEKEGRCSVADAKSLRQELTRRRLSFQAKQSDCQVLLARLAQIAKVPKGTFLPGGREGYKARLSRSQPTKPTWGGGEPVELTPEQCKKAAAEQLKNSGYAK